MDIKYPEYTEVDADEFEILDLRRWANCLQATRGIEHVYALAADMGGMGFISATHSLILHNNALINLRSLEATRLNGVSRYLCSSSACIYPEHMQTDAEVTSLREEDAYPANPRDATGGRNGHGEAVLVLRGRLRDRHADRSVHNIYGLYGTYEGGREKGRRRCAGRSRWLWMVSINELARIIIDISGKRHLD